MRETPVVIIDFGSQTTQLIARRVRELGFYCEVHPFHRPAAEILARSPQALILSGGPASVDDPQAPTLAPELWHAGLPIFGICYGAQLMNHVHGGLVTRAPTREFGKADISHEVDLSAPFHALFPDAPQSAVWMSHGDHIARLAPGFSTVCTSSDGVVAAIADPTRRLFGVQFHPEVHHTPRGSALLRSFLSDVAGLQPDWTPGRFIADAIARIRAQVGSGHVICGLSGGVDSAVAAALVHRAIGDRLHCIFVDTGLMRSGEAPDVVRTFRDELGFSLTALDAGPLFFAALAGQVDPETKRKIIGHRFIELFEDAAKSFKEAAFLCQGTLYPDVIESVSVSGASSVIKSHHNVGGLPDHMKLELVEPLRDLFKDEVRAIGLELGLPERVVMRQPFPGPGLAIRVLGEVTPARVATLQAADLILRDELSTHPDTRDASIWQSFAVLLPVRTVGVMGDRRTYEEVCALRAVSSVDGMTADVYPVPHAVLGRIATRIVNEVPGINRVVFDLTAKPPGTIEWE